MVNARGVLDFSYSQVDLETIKRSLSEQLEQSERCTNNLITLLMSGKSYLKEERLLALYLVLAFV